MFGVGKSKKKLWWQVRKKRKNSIFALYFQVYMKNKAAIASFIVSLVYLSYSCIQRSGSHALDSVAQVMEQYPDSALYYLEAIEYPEQLVQPEYAYYCLLLTEANDKNYIAHTSDSVISIAAGYFESTSNIELKAKAWYYMGRVNQDLLQSEKAIDYYIKAVSYAKETDQYRLLALIYSHASTVYRQQTMNDNALSAAIKAYDYCVLSDNKEDMAYALRDIGRVYLFMENPEAALDKCKQALAIADEVQDAGLQVAILNDMGAIYEVMGNLQEALRTVNKAIGITEDEEDKNTNYLSLGSLYLQMNELDSAMHYLDIAGRSSNLYTQAGAFYYLYVAYKEKEDPHNSLKYYEEYQKLNKLTSQSEQKEEILKLVHQYEQRELKKEMELRSVRDRFFYSLCILLLLVILTISSIAYARYRWSKERILRLQEKQIQYEKHLRLLSEEQIKNNRRKINLNYHKLRSKEEELQSAQYQLLSYNTRLLSAENELIALRREEHEFRDKLFDQTGLAKRIHLAGMDLRKRDTNLKPFTLKNFHELTIALNEIYDEFEARLRNKYPQLKERDIQICTLIKAKAKTGNIAEIIAMTPNAVTKKKRLILDKMEIVDQAVSLEELLDTF